MSSDLLAINPNQRQELSEVVSNTSITLEETLQSKSPQEQAMYLRDGLIGLEGLMGTITQAMLNFLWQIHSRELWMVPLEDGVQYDSFRDWIDAQLDPTFKRSKFDKKTKWEWLQDAVRIIERTLTYAKSNPAKDAQGKLVTPIRLIEEVKFGKLKMTSSYFTDNEKTPERQNLLVELTTAKSSTLRKKYSEPRIPPIHAAVDVRPTEFVGYNLTDVYLMGLTPTQMKFLETALGEVMFKQHLNSMREADREALLGILPVDARQQSEEDVEVIKRRIKRQSKTMDKSTDLDVA